MLLTVDIGRQLQMTADLMNLRLHWKQILIVAAVRISMSQSHGWNRGNISNKFGQSCCLYFVVSIQRDGLLFCSKHDHKMKMNYPHTVSLISIHQTHMFFRFGHVHCTFKVTCYFSEVSSVNEKYDFYLKLRRNRTSYFRNVTSEMGRIGRKPEITHFRMHIFHRIKKMYFV